MGAGAKIATKGGVVTINRAGQRTLRNLLAKHLSTIGDDLVRTGKALRPAELMKAAQGAARGEMAEMIARGATQFVDKGGLKLGIPFTGIERTLVAGGPIGQAANIAGAGFERVVGAAMAPVSGALRAVGRTAPAQMLKRAFRHSTGFLDVDALRQYAKGTENLYGAQFLDELNDFGRQVQKAKLSPAEVELVTLGAEEPAKIARIAKELGVDLRPEVKDLARSYGSKWREWGDVLRQRGVELPQLGSGIDYEIARLAREERKLVKRLEKAKGRRQARLAGSTARPTNWPRPAPGRPDRLRSVPATSRL
jgi:hypothetical protein